MTSNSNSNTSGLAPLRPLLSAPCEPTLSAESSIERNANRKREVVVAACEYCRKRKAKKSHDALQQVFQALRSREDEDALAIFQRIRQHEDAE
ncbi:hypothetical protein E4U52_000187, partial [Claviceps spartinae]